jgi:ribose/xylose/arabinose/galactoside ABC-type transport system permease subunit
MSLQSGPPGAVTQPAGADGPGPDDAPSSSRRGRLRRARGETTVMNRKLLINVFALILLAVVLTSMSENFLTSVNIWNVLRQVSVIVIVGAAVTLVMIAGGLDLSVGGVLALTGVAAVILSKSGIPIPIACAIAVLIGAGVGLLNGLLIVIIGINSVIATLGTLYVTRGIALLWTDGRPVIAPKGYSELGTGYFLGVPIPVWLMFVVVAVFIVIERRSVLGRYAVAVGSNSEAAFLSGIPVQRTKLVLFTIAGAMAGFGGVILSSRFSSGVPTTGIGFEFDVIVATVLGGTSLTGGEGSVLGMLLGALIVGVLTNGLNILGIESFWQTVVQGVVLVLAVGLDIVLRKGWIGRPAWLPGRRPTKTPAPPGEKAAS